MPQATTGAMIITGYRTYKANFGKLAANRRKSDSQHRQPFNFHAH